MFLCSAAIIWFFAGVLIDAVSRLATRFKLTGFIMAFFVLGFLTSIGEISVAINSTIAGVPDVSIGNLIGASFVITLLIVPLLAIAGGTVSLRGTVSPRALLMLLAVILVPVLVTLDGNVTQSEGLLALLVYGTVAFALYHTRAPGTFTVETKEDRAEPTHRYVLRVGVAAIAIFIAAHFLVEEAVFVATSLSVPASLVGLLMLSIGTNLPELVIALRSVLRSRADIAFGDYLGSAAMNTLIFGGLAVASGTVMLEPSQFIETGILMAVGFVLLFIFLRTSCQLSRWEGVVLLVFYILFLLVQTGNLIRFAVD